MRGLPGLIRLNQWKVDEERRKVSELEMLATDLQSQLTGLQDQIDREGGLPRETVEDQRAFSAFLQGALQRRDTLLASIREINSQVDAARDDLAAAYRELKSVEVAKASRDRAAARREELRDRARLDEIGLEIFRRRSSGLA